MKKDKGYGLLWMLAAEVVLLIFFLAIAPRLNAEGLLYRSAVPVTPEAVSYTHLMVNKLQPDVVMCGPAFNFADYAGMCAKVACDINATTKAKAFAAMSVENKDTIAAYKDKVAIVETPKKGGMGLNDALKNMCALAKALADGSDTAELEHKFCFK